MSSLKPEATAIDSSNVPLVLKPLLNAGMAAASLACPALAIPIALLGCIYSEIKEQSTQKMLEQLQAKYDDLNSRNLISQEFLESDHYAHLMIDILRKVYAFNTEQKREAVAQIYQNILRDEIKYADSDEQSFIEALEKINTQEIAILIFMKKNETSLKTIDSWEKFFTLYCNQNSQISMDKYKFKFFALQLEQMGLVFCSDLFGYDANFQVLGLSESQPNSAGVTPMGKRFLEYLKTDGC